MKQLGHLYGRTSVVPLPLPLCWRGCGQLKQVSDITFLRARCRTTILSITVQHHFFLHSYADLLLTSLWPRSSVKRDAIQNTSRVPCGIRIQNYKIYTQRSDYTLRFLREWENFTEGFNYISFRCLQNLVTFSDFLVHTKTRISGTGKTIWTEHDLVMPPPPQGKWAWWTAITYLKTRCTSSTASIHLWVLQNPPKVHPTTMVLRCPLNWGSIHSVKRYSRRRIRLAQPHDLHTQLKLD